MRTRAGTPTVGRREASRTKALPFEAADRLSTVAFFFGLIGLIGVFMLTSVSLVRAELLLNEILSAPTTDWDGDGLVDFKGDEWVEILNVGTNDESLAGVFLRDGTGDTYHYGFSGVLAAGETLTVYGSEAVAWQTSQGLSTTGLSLNNSGDRVELWRDVAAPRVLDALDAVEVPSHAAAAERALAREPGFLAWALYDGLNPYTGTLLPTTSGCVPTPAETNECRTLVANQATRWSTVKTQFVER